jgi:uncharacterized membrane protein
MITNEKSITIYQPIVEVFDYISDLQNGPEWQSGLVEVQRITAGPLGVGTRFSSVRKFMSLKLEAEIEFTTYEPNKEIDFKSISGSSPFVQTFLFEPVSDGTKVTSRLELQTGGLMGLAEPLIASSVKREIDADLHHMKCILETRVTEVAQAFELQE